MSNHPGTRQGRGPGSVGRPVNVVTNSFPVEALPSDRFYHYDEIDGHSRRRKLQIWDQLQIQYASLFNPRAAYDGNKNMFRSKPIDLPNNSGKFVVYLSGSVEEQRRRQAKGVEVAIKLVATINPISLYAVVKGQRGATMGSEELTSMTLLNVLIRMAPLLTHTNKNTYPDAHPSNARSFFVKRGSVGIGSGLELWRGYFQSVRLSIDRLLVNVDIATAVMYQPGSLIDLAMEYIGVRSPKELRPEQLGERRGRMLEGFLKGLLVFSTLPNMGPPGKLRSIKGIEHTGTNDYTFECNGEECTVSEYFKRTYNYSVQLGKIISLRLSNTKDVVLPMEIFSVKAGQFYKKTLSSAETAQALRFSTQRPEKRLADIKEAYKSDLLGYNVSDFLRFSGMKIGNMPMVIPGRTLPALKIKYGNNFEESPINGAWNVMNRKLVEPRDVISWAVMVFDRNASSAEVGKFVSDLRRACGALGMGFPSNNPPILNARPQGNYDSLEEQCEDAYSLAVEAYRQTPTFILVILPDFAPEIITAVKYWGDCRKGCTTQCVKRGKMQKANNQYCNNVALKINIRIGGVNWYPSETLQAMKFLKTSPTMVVGADVSHAGPDSTRPSVAGLVSSVDLNMCRYVASTSVQEGRVEGIMGLGDMMAHAISMFDKYQKTVFKQSIPPQRIIFYRDGLSEGQFEGIAREEIKIIKGVLRKMKVDAKIVYIVVGKRHHIRFFPSDKSSDRSGNCEAGLVVDQLVVHPIEYDFYLQSHAGLLGTSRSAHYSVIEDELKLHGDALQGVSFALCHVFGRATRSVSIPAPVYYADLVCGRGKYHSLLLRDEYEAASFEEPTLEDHKKAFRSIHPNMVTTMYWI